MILFPPLFFFSLGFERMGKQCLFTDRAAPGHHRFGILYQLPSSPHPNPPLLFSPGGFSKFQAEFALHCETNLDSSCSSSSPPLPVLGLGGLRISSDSSSDIESDIDRDPNSATDSDGSPLSTNQPSFPVEILPYLYLGCAKDSTNLDVLEEFGIKYILNVTPNLPNLFENAGEFKYKQIPISDHWSQNLSQFFPEAISFIGELRALRQVLEFCLVLRSVLGEKR